MTLRNYDTARTLADALEEYALRWEDGEVSDAGLAALLIGGAQARALLAVADALREPGVIYTRDADRV